MNTKSYRLVGAYGDGELSRHSSFKKANVALHRLSRHERDAAGNVFRSLVSKQVDLSPEIQDAIYSQLWDLYE